MKRKYKMLPSNARLNEVLSYNPKTGELRWKVNKRNVKAGNKAGCLLRRTGYRSISIDGAVYLEHRICYKIATGWDPGMFEIDHINGVRDDNRISNLRMVDHATNGKNTCMKKNNSSGHNGIYFHKATKKWMARARVNHKWHYLGIFEKLEDAVAARAAADVKYGFHVNHGRVG